MSHLQRTSVIRNKPGSAENSSTQRLGADVGGAPSIARIYRQTFADTIHRHSVISIDLQYIVIQMYRRGLGLHGFNEHIRKNIRAVPEPDPILIRAGKTLSALFSDTA